MFLYFLSPTTEPNNSDLPNYRIERIQTWIHMQGQYTNNDTYVGYERILGLSDHYYREDFRRKESI
ncbi:unnamed protein product [Trifolium pratense]|uniref:Uncharacterized protein n=1 Tax=Trifolium pratense TaxID=57577 RepID=A0ACB0IL40_TRIPR|nr:unnamed protein product [Trifolium pratense]